MDWDYIFTIAWDGKILDRDTRKGLVIFRRRVYGREKYVCLLIRVYHNVRVLGRLGVRGRGRE